MDVKRNIKLILAYDGKRYHGWQRQKDDISIQEVIEDRIQIMTRESVSLIASGRTDAGVHALGQVCNFFTESSITPESFKNGLNSLLPNDIYIRQADNVSPQFHSRYSAKSKVYEYRILNRTEQDIFFRNYTWHIKDELDIDKMRYCLSLLIGKHNFSSFRSSGSKNRNPVREMIRAELLNLGDGNISLIFEADGFLRNMVRNIVGSIIEVGQVKISDLEFKEIISSKDRQTAGKKAPPQGLFLKRVKY